jgi:hypothetical protein
MKHALVSLQELLAFKITGCIGKTNDGTCCGNPISKRNLHDANGIRDAIRSGADTAYIEQRIPELAALCLCKRRHQDQGAKLAQTWRLEEATRPSRTCNKPFNTQARVSVALDRVFTELNLMDAELDRHDQQMQDIVQRFKHTMSVHEETQSHMRPGNDTL